MTVKTVEWHLKHSYGKLGISSRRELAAALGRKYPCRLTRAPDVWCAAEEGKNRSEIARSLGSFSRARPLRSIYPPNSR